MQAIQTVKGFRDFPPSACAQRNYIFLNWRTTAQNSGFSEYEVPICESAALYRRKSGDEILGQIFWFKDKMDREIALRPEITPSLARLAASSQREYKKPMKWFQIGSCFRYEEPGRGRTREFTQCNVDILGEASPEADAEVIATALLMLKSLGFNSQDIAIRLSDRRAWDHFAKEKHVTPENKLTFLQIIDRVGKVPESKTADDLQQIGVAWSDVRDFLVNPTAATPFLAPVINNLRARGLADFLHVDMSIVRGLAYYTGLVFEIFDLKHDLRAVAGGGRYDNLCQQIGGVDIPAVGFAMGDVVLGELLHATPHALQTYTNWLSRNSVADVFCVLLDEDRRPQLLAALQTLRESGIRAEALLTPAKPARQFQQAETVNARYALIFGTEYPEIPLKNMATREQIILTAGDLVPTMKTIINTTPTT